MFRRLKLNSIYGYWHVVMSRVPMRWSAEHLQRVPGSAGHLLRPRRRQADEDPPPPGDEEVLLHSR